MASLSSRVVALAIMALISPLAFSGCSPAEIQTEAEAAPIAPTQAVPAEATKPMAPQESEADPAAATRLPDSCSELLPASVLQASEPRIEMFDTSAEIVIGRMQIDTGPLTMSTLLSGEQQLYCSFGIRQTDGGGSIGVAVIPEQKKVELLEALRASVYEEVAPGNAEAAFFQGANADHRYTEEILFDGDVLIAVPRTIGGNFAWDALTVIQAQR